MDVSGSAAGTGRRPWTFLTSHAAVLLAIADAPDIRLRELAARVGLTERAVNGVVRDLVEAGYVTRTRVGRRNQYRVDTERPMRHPITSGRQVRDLLALIGDGADSPAGG